MEKREPYPATKEEVEMMTLMAFIAVRFPDGLKRIRAALDAVERTFPEPVQPKSHLRLAE